MGLTKSKYYVKDYDITISKAYAICSGISVHADGSAIANFSIFKTREDAVSGTKKPFECVSFLIIGFDRSRPVFEQAYAYAKEHGFEGWQDDIVETEAENE